MSEKAIGEVGKVCIVINVWEGVGRIKGDGEWKQSGEKEMR